MEEENRNISAPITLDRDEVIALRGLVGSWLEEHLRNYELMDNIMVYKPWMCDAIEEYSCFVALHGKLTEMLKQD